MVTTQRPSAANFERRLRRHPFPIDDEPPEWPLVRRRFIPCEEAWSAQGQVQVAAMGGYQERMAPVVMQEQECPTAQDLASTPNHAPWQQVIAENWFPVSVHVVGRQDRPAFLGSWFP
jgi:hypothetical protein